MDEGVRLDGGPGLGERVKAARRRRGLSRRAAAELCARSEEWLRKVERGQRGTSLRMVARLAEVLRVPLAELLGEGASPSVWAAGACGVGAGAGGDGERAGGGGGRRLRRA